MQENSDVTGTVVIPCAGAALSTAGYALMLVAAASSPAWCRRRTSRLWLHLCGTKLLYTYLFLWLYLGVAGVVPAPWISSVVGFTVHDFCVDVLFLASCNWLAAGAWLAYRQLVTTTPNAVHPHFIKRAALFAYLTPLPIKASSTAIRLLIEESDHIILAIITCFIMLNSIWCMCLYSWALCSMYGSRRSAGRPPPDLAATAVLALMFALTSGLQYVVLFGGEYYLTLSENSDSVVQKILVRVSLCIIFYNVFVYTILFLLGIKQTRRLWCDMLKSKFPFCFISMRPPVPASNV